jgi:hypothetical protein
MKLEQIGMRAGSKKSNYLITGYVGYNPVALYMTFRKTIQIAVELMFMAAFRQWFIPDKRNHNVKYFIQIFAAFLHKLEVFFELVGKVKIKHRLEVQVFPRFFERTVPFRRNFPSHNSFGFFKSRHSNSVIERFSGFRITVFGADGTFPVNSYVKSGTFGFYGVHNNSLYLEYMAFQGKKQYV